MQAPGEEEKGERSPPPPSPPPPPPALVLPAPPSPPPLGEVASHGAACGVRWRRLPRLTEAQLRERLREEEEGEKKREGNGGGEGGSRESVPLHARLEGRLVPTSSCPPPFSSSADAPAAPAAARLDRAHVAVIDNFVSERARAELLSLVVFGRREEEEKGSSRRYDELSGSEGLPRPRWERRTADSAEDAAALEGEEEEEEGGGGGGGGVGSGRRLGWGLSSPAIDDLLSLASLSLSPPPPRALAEVGSKLSAMFPEHDCLWLPTESMEDGRKGRERERRKKQGGEREQEDDEKNGGDAGGDGGFGGGDDGGDGGFGGGGDDKPFSSSATSPPLLANAASSSDAFSYHVDCDPDSSSHPGTPWHEAYGHYVNGEPNKPLLVSLVLYLNESWQPAFAGETLVTDSTAGVGCAVLPRPRRALLLESDVLHKVCPPSSGDCCASAAAGNRLRFSLVFKLALCPKRTTTSFSSLSSSSSSSSNRRNSVNVLSREWWGPPADLGSAKALSELVRRVGEERKRKRSGGGEGEGGGGGEGGGEGKEEDKESGGGGGDGGNGKQRAN